MKSKYAILILFLIHMSVFSGCKQQTDKNNKSKTGTNTLNNNTSLKGPVIDIYGAALEGDLAKVTEALRNGQKANTPDQEGRTALMYAAYDGRTEIMRYLLENGAGVNLKDNAGRTALMMASSGSFPEAVSLLLDNFADPNLTDRVDHFTALMYAAAEGQLEVAKILLARGADPSLKDKDGDTALSFASKNGHKEIVTLLQSVKSK